MAKLDEIVIPKLKGIFSVIFVFTQIVINRVKYQWAFDFWIVVGLYV